MAYELVDRPRTTAGRAQSGEGDALIQALLEAGATGKAVHIHRAGTKPHSERVRVGSLARQRKVTLHAHTDGNGGWFMWAERK